MADAVDRLTRAAAAAEGQATVRKAIGRAWAEIHHPVEDWPHCPAMAAAFRAWADLELGEGRWPGDVAEVVSRRYDTPAEIAGSLRRAADIIK